MSGQQIQNISAQSTSIFDPNTIDSSIKVAEYICKSDIIPANYRQKPGNCLVAMDIASRMGMPPMMVMQNLDIIFGRPSWNAQFCISAIMSRFGAIGYEENDLGKFKHQNIELQNKSCRVVAGGKKGPIITIEMAVKAGWYFRKDSKWPAIPEQMLVYRAATFFARKYCPDMLLGIHTIDEQEDMHGLDPMAEVKIEKAEPTIEVKTDKPKAKAKKETEKQKDEPLKAVDVEAIIVSDEDEQDDEPSLADLASVFND